MPCRLLSVLLLLLGSLVLVALVPAQESGPPPLALLVGVTNYQDTGLNSLNFCVRDMALLRDELTRAGFKVTLLSNPGASKKGIEQALDRLLRERQPGQMLLVAFSGHGLQSLNLSGQQDAFFCPFGCDKSNQATLVSLSALVDRLGNKGTNLVLVDACRDDPRKSFQGDELQGKLPARTAVLFSCSAGQASFETNRMYSQQTGFDPKSTEGHGVFMYHILEGLRGQAQNKKGEVTWNGLVDYLQDNVNKQAKLWLQEDARRLADRRKINLGRLEFQTPHQLANLNQPVLLVPPPLGKEVINSIGLTLVRIPRGKFKMGSPPSEPLRNPNQKKWDEEEQHEVEITTDFYLGQCEVTQQEHEQVMGKNPSYFAATGQGKDLVKGMDTRRFPVECVSWQEASEFCKQLTGREKDRGWSYRLPTEAEWEYACRAGTTTPFSFGSALNGDKANCNGMAPYGTETKGVFLQRTTEVKAYPPNAWGLYGMHGNVREWCLDYYGPYKGLSPRDPVQLKPQVEKDQGVVARGGSWFIDSGHCRAAERMVRPVRHQSYAVGFRVVLVPRAR